MPNGPSYLPTNGALLPRGLPVDPSVYNDENLQAELAKRSAMGLEYQPGPPPPAPIMPDADILRKAASLKAFNDSMHSFAASRPATMMSVKQGRDVNLENPYAKQALASQNSEIDLPAQLEQQRVKNLGQYNSLLSDYNSRAAQVRNANISGGEQFLRDQATLPAAKAINEAKVDNTIKVDNNRAANTSTLEDKKEADREKLAGVGHQNRMEEIPLRAQTNDQLAQAKEGRKQMTIGPKDTVPPNDITSYQEAKAAESALNDMKGLISKNPSVLNALNGVRYSPENQNIDLESPVSDPDSNRLFKDLQLAHHYLIQDDKRRGTNNAASMLGQVLPRFGNRPEDALRGADSLLGYIGGLKQSVANSQPRFDFEAGDWKPEFKEFTKNVQDKAVGRQQGATPAAPQAGQDNYDTRKYMARTPKGTRVPPESIPELIKFARSPDPKTAAAAKATLEALTIKE